MYSKRVWLNEENSPSTGSVVAFDGFVRDDKEEWRSTFLELSDCYGKARLHKASYDSTEDFIEKMKLLRNEIDLFIDYLEKDGNGMSYDMCACKGSKPDLSIICPLCEKCKRYIIGKKAEEYGCPMLWTKPQYKDGKCELFIEVKDD